MKNLKNTFFVIALLIFMPIVSMEEEEIERMEDPNAIVHDEMGTTVLMQVAQQRDLAEVQHYLKAGAKVNERDKKNQTALMHHIIKQGKFVLPSIVKALIEAGTDVNLVDKNGNNALHYLLQVGQELGRVGNANANEMEKFRKYYATPLLESFELLLNNATTASVNQKLYGTRGTPLEIAAQIPDIRFVRLLLEKGATPSQRAVENANINMNPDIAQLIQSKLPR